MTQQQIHRHPLALWRHKTRSFNLPPESKSQPSATSWSLQLLQDSLHLENKSRIYTRAPDAAAITTINNNNNNLFFFFFFFFSSGTMTNTHKLIITEVVCREICFLVDAASINQSIYAFHPDAQPPSTLNSLMLFHALFNADPSLVLLHMKLKLIHACSKSLDDDSSSSSSPSCKSVFFFLNSIFSQCTCSLCNCVYIFLYWEIQGPNSF